MVRWIGEAMMSRLVRFAASISVISVFLICFFIFAKGIPPMIEIGFGNFLFGTEWQPTDEPPAYGILPMFAGSIFVTVGAVTMGVPVALATALYMVYFCPSKLVAPLRSLVNLLAGIPSIVYGFFGMIVLVPFVRTYFGGSGNSVFTASLLLAIMILPTVASVSEAALRAVPELYYEGARALGRTHERSVFYVLLPAASSGIFTAIVLGIGRAVGETMAVIMVAGNQVVLPKGIFEGTRTLTTNIVMEMGYAADLHQGALIATGAILFIMILLLNAVFIYLKEKVGKTV